MSIKFVHLHLHSEYSLVDGIVRIKSLPEAVADQGMPAVAITDQCNLFGMVKFYRAALAAGIKPIIGADVWIKNPADDKAPFKLILLCQNQIGYHNLTELISRAYLDGQLIDKPLIEFNWLQNKTDGFIALSGAREGEVGRALLNDNLHAAEQVAKKYHALFPNRFYLELQRTNRPDEARYISSAITLAEKLQIPVVATNDVRFLQSDDFEAHEARICIHGGYVLDDARRPKNYSEAQYLKSADEMAELFADIPSALENTVEIAKRCNLELTLGENFLPKFPVPNGMSTEEYFKQQAEQGLQQRFKTINADKKPYDERLLLELEVINSMGYPGYFLIVADFIKWSKDNGIPVGPGRGSGAGSLVAYSLGITDLDPIEHELLFERFLNPERVSMPDFDIDFCMEGRDRVIDYVAGKYGRESVSQIITYGTMAAKAVVRDVGRVLGHPYGFVDKLAKLVPFELGITLKKALQREERLLELYNDEEDVKYLFNLAIKLEGIPRNAGKHAGGVVIAPSKLTDFAPLYCEQGGDNLVTQFDKDDVEAVGLVKFDFLGLRTLTIIDWALQTINNTRDKKVDINHIPMDDEKTFELLKNCNTTAIFQLESHGMKELIKRLQPDRFDDIVALVALFRPGPLQSGMVDDFIDRKHGRAKVEYLHPLLEKVLEPTYGIILYQEQVMLIAQILSGYTLGGADILRSAMGKKKPQEMAKQRAVFVDGAINNKVDAHQANEIFDLIEKFAGYGFNKSHSVAYALIAYQTAYLKAHYPAEFMAAVLSSDMDNTDKVVRIYNDTIAMDIVIHPPDINQGDYQFTAKNNEIIYGLGAIKGVGEAAIESILAARNKGPFVHLFEFCQRVETRKVNRKVLEALIRSGSFDGFGEQRSTLLASIDAALKAAEQAERDKAHGQNSLFADEEVSHDINVDYVKVIPLREEVRLQGEKDTLGLYFSGHPIARFEAELEKFTTAPIAELRNDQKAKIAGFVTSLRIMNSKRGRIAFLSITDKSGSIDVGVFSGMFERYRDYLIKDELIIVEGEVAADDYTGGQKITADKIMLFDHARENYARHLLLKVDEKKLNPDFIQQLTSNLTPYKGGRCVICIDYQKAGACSTIKLGDQWRVRPKEELLEKLRQSFGADAVNLIY